MTLPRNLQFDIGDDGVTTIVGREPYDVAERFGRHQAAAYPAALFTAFASATGRLCATLGLADATNTRAADVAGDAHVAWDLDVRRLRFVEHGRRILRAMPDDVRPWVDGFAAGVERARRELRRDGLDPVLDRLTARRITPAVICALDYRIASHHELGRLDAMRRGVRTVTPRASNAIAIGRTRVRGGGALLLIDPHIPLFSTPELRLIPVRLRTRGYRASGVARLGSPLVFLGFSRHLGWAITTNWPDTLRWFVLRRRGTSYLESIHEGERRHRRIVQAVDIDIAGRRSRRFSIEFAGTLSRPVWCGLPGGRRAAVTPSVASAGDISTQLYRAATVRTTDAFRRRVLATPGAACTNFVVADRRGRIGCAWYGRVPRLGGGYLDPARDLPWDDGGDDGYVVQNNAHFDRLRPRSPLAIDDYPVRVADGFVSVTSFRQERCLRRLAGRRRLAAADLLRLALDPHDGRIASFVTMLANAIGSSPSIRRWTRGRRARLGRALGPLRRWTGRFDRGSRVATLAALWFERTQRLPAWDPTWWERPDFVPERLPARTVSAAGRALLAAAETWRAARKPRWGDVHTLTVGRRRIPVDGFGHANRCTAGLGPPDLDPDTLDFPVEAGGPALIVVRFGRGDPSASALVVNGPAENVEAPAVVAAAARWARGDVVRLTLASG